jgi:hypothetical protein
MFFTYPLFFVPFILIKNQGKLFNDPSDFDKQSVVGELRRIRWNHFDIEKVDIVSASFSFFNQYT